MSTKTLTRNGSSMPTVFDDFFKPWNEWFDSGSNLFNKMLTIPAVNIIESKEDFKLDFAVPGMKKEDFHLNIEGNMLTISSEKETSKDLNHDSRYTRKEYSYSSFSRSFSLPEDVNSENIEASYHDGILHITMPKKEEAKKLLVKNISVK